MKLNRLTILILFLPIFTIFSQFANSGSNAFQQSVRYEIDLNLNISENIIVAEEKLFYRNNSPDTLEYVWFHLYPNAYKNENSIFAREMAERGVNDFFYTSEKDRGYIEIKKISVNNLALTTRFKENDETELKVNLDKSLSPGDSVIFEIQFKVKIPSFISRMGQKDLRYEITQWYPKIAVYDNNGWHNDGYHFLGEFYGEYGDYKVSFNVPEWMWVAATGENIDKDEIAKINDMVLFTSKIDSLPKKLKRLKLDSIVTVQKEIKKCLLAGKFKNKKITFVAQNVHDFAWACDYRYLIKESFYENTKILTYVTPKHYIGWEYSNDYASDALRYMSNWYGDYIYPVLNVVESNGPYGGMEYPNLVLITSRGDGLLRTFEEVIFHEIAHQWFYGMLGNNEINDAWLDEGLTMFSEMRYFREKYKGSFSNSKFLNLLGLDQITEHSELMKANLYFISGFDYIPPASEPSPNYRSRLEFSNVYVRTAFTLDMLKYELGDSLFNTCMKEYYKRFLLKHVSPASLINTFNDVTSSSWDWYFRQWIYTQEQLNLKAGKLESYSQSENQFETSFKIIKESKLKTNCKIEFTTKQNERFVERIFIEQPETEIRVNSKDEIISARIDPHNELLEFNRRDNSTNYSGFRLKSPISTPSFDKYTLMVSPLANYTDYSKWGLGGTIWYNPYNLQA
ncbi:MAG TPA: M1 family metallopeptidase, partial [bacterium]|nr:M1 family metallopeptidase [bacterium]